MSGATPRPTRVVYRKACKCRATASTDAVRFSQEYNGTRDVLTFILTLIPGPSCDKCGKPWVLDPPAEREAEDAARTEDYIAEDYRALYATY